MPTNLLLISERPEDFELVESLAQDTEFGFKRSTDLEVIEDYIKLYPRTLTVWDGDDKERVGEIASALRNQIPRTKMFVLSDDELMNLSQVEGAPSAYYIKRRSDPVSRMVYSNLLESSFDLQPFGIRKYFETSVPSQKIALTHSSQKTAAVQAIDNVLSRRIGGGRLAGLVARATDELIMNAIFDAPVLPDGTTYRRHVERAEDFELIGREKVQLELIFNSKYAGICVRDNFGTLKRDVIMKFFSKNYHEEAYAVDEEDKGAGLGLHGILQSGLSLIFVSRPGSRTEVSIFFPTSGTYKDFRQGFRFLAVLSE